MPSLTDIITRLDEKIYALIDDVDNVTTYRLGDKTVNKTEMLQALTALRDKYALLAEKEPYEDIRHVALDYGDFGEEEIEFIGDTNT